MKISSRKLLVFLYSRENLHFSVGYEPLRLLLPEMSSEGLRSSLHLLVKKGYVFRRMLGRNAVFSLTQIGYQVVEQLYPFLNSERESSQGVEMYRYCLLIKEGNASAGQKRQLLGLLKRYQAIGKGMVFFLPELSASLLRELTLRYSTAVTIHHISEWVIGNAANHSTVPAPFLASETILSGISKEIDYLLKSKNQHKYAINQSNLTIFSVFERIFTLFEQMSQSPLVEIEQKTSSRAVLRQFQELFS